MWTILKFLSKISCNFYAFTNKIYFKIVSKSTKFKFEKICKAQKYVVITPSINIHGEIQVALPCRKYKQITLELKFSPTLLNVTRNFYLRFKRIKISEP